MLRGRLTRFSILRLLVTACALILLACCEVRAAELQDIARTAKVSTEPACEPASVSALTDGDPNRGILFSAGTKGDATITLRFARPREIARVRLLQTSDAYYSTACEIIGDADGSGRFGVPIARTTKLSPPGEWQVFEFAPVRVTALRFRSLAGVSKGARAHPILGELEVWGKPEPGDLEETIRMGTRPDYVASVKKLFLDTDLVASGKASCVILVPEGEGYAAMGKQIADEIERRTRVRVPVTTGLSEADPSRTNVIALGQMVNNPLIERLYWNRYVFNDSAWPGADGYAIQTVHNPYPWTSGHNVVVLGGSTEVGVKRAVTEFLTMLPAGPDLRLGYCLKVGLPAEPSRGEHTVLSSPKFTFKARSAKPSSVDIIYTPRKDWPQELLPFLGLALNYLFTGDEGSLQEAKRTLLAMADAYDKEPDRGPTWPDETQSRYIFAVWDAVEESPVFSDAERLRITNMLLRFLYSLIPRTSGYGTLEKNDTITWNHTTYPLMGLYFGGRYFRYYYGLTYMDTFLKKALGAFSGQEKSWKPQCDADSYLVLTMGHTIEYSLAEGRMKFFEDGLCRAYADYLMGICDNRGLAPGFGDSGLVRTTDIPLRGVPYALWYYRDGRYLWYLNTITGGVWANPYHPEVRPAPPQDMVGVRVFPLDRQVYDFTKTRPYYNEPPSPPNVPFEQAFDKIAFRENLDPSGQYFVLDGYARGKHLHYDGNAILKFTQDGEDWLVDGDYLVRNTTEHNMVSVIRDGRCEEMIPVCAGLLHHADLPTRGFTATVVKGYNGADWERFIAWRKGDWVVVTDRMKASQPGRYSFDCVWKCIDLNSEEVFDARRLRISRGRGAHSGHFLLERVRDAEAKTQEALIFTAQNSQFETTVNLPAGEYRPVVYARGLDTGTDSLWLSIDGGEPVAHHLPIGRIGPSSATHQKDTPPPTLKVEKSGEHILTITLREAPGVALDRIAFEGVGAGQGTVEIVAAQAPSASVTKSPDLRSFYVVSADPVGLSLVRRRGSSGPVKLLFQRQSATLREGEAATFRNLLYLDKRGEQKGYDLHPLAPHNSLLVAGGQRIISCDGLDAGGLSSDAAMAEVAPDCISLLDATRLTGARELLTASRPVSLEINLASGSVTAVATADTDLKLAGTPNARLVPGKNVLALSDPNLWKQELGRALQSIGLPAVQTYVAQPPPAVPAHPRACGTPALRAPLRELWKFQGSPMIEISDFASADIDGDGHPETLICAGRELICLDEQGKQRWRFACKQPLLCVCVADINGDKRPEVLCGGKDEFFHILDTSGRLLAEHQMTEQLVIGQGGTRAPYVKSIAAADLDGDGAVEIVVGCTNSNISAFRASDLSRLWNFNGIYHGVGRIALADLDGDGKLETLVSDHYGSLHVIRSDGRRKVSAYSELGDVIFDAGDINGDGKLELLNGSSTGVLTASAYPIKPLWSFNNYGYAARCVLARDLDGDGKAKTIVGSDMGYLFALGSDGKPKWQLEVGSAILALEYAAVLPKEPSPVADPPPAGKVLIAALRHGALLVISPKGQVLRRMPQPSPVTKILTVPAAGRPDCLLVLDESNAVRFVELSP